MSHPLFEAWLDTPPGAELLETWRDYIEVVLHQLDAEERRKLRESLLHRGRQIAKASGGFLGVGKISKGERKALEEIEAALSGSES